MAEHDQGFAEAQFLVWCNGEVPVPACYTETIIVADILAVAIDESFIKVVDSGLPVHYLIAPLPSSGAGF